MRISAGLVRGVRLGTIVPSMLVPTILSLIRVTRGPDFTGSVAPLGWDHSAYGRSLCPRSRCLAELRFNRTVVGARAVEA